MFRQQKRLTQSVLQGSSTRLAEEVTQRADRPHLLLERAEGVANSTATALAGVLCLTLVAAYARMGRRTPGWSTVRVGSVNGCR